MITSSYVVHDGTGSTAYYSPSFPRGGASAYFTVNVTHKSGSPTMVCTVEHKNEGDTSWGTAGTITNITATGVKTLDVGGGILKEELRFTFTFSAGSAGDFMAVQIPNPGWRPE